MKRTAFPVLALYVAACSGCATYYSAEIDHTSHAAQHIGEHPTNYGYTALSMTANWENDKGFFRVSEGIVLEPCITYYNGYQQCGGLSGPREVFRAVAGIKFGGTDK